ncbi:bifunctional adenosylcobinamide kinase/adenosylcobinamide-phosphate guanylyltransferase [Neobacillus dielmonensis]|uniref:bifunctional adenosylcobinamide kinase/adenosylcobinamide-phosphate guanylyltransferase n=1 Tax=Neobacillus dielmonensis TaxID=1347369 RepID=UPI0005A74C79|nr:bifunctional adenosylcobinamide kinase/adenosylcobinamide-phosphate guanylyltransferase [Neobacillus dielmonensis]
MHFITGGAFNGKRSWVKNNFNIMNSNWLSAYEGHPLPVELDDITADLIVLEGIEIWIKGLTEEHDAAQCRVIWNRCLTHWERWEKTKNHQLILIGTDMTKGIVPIEKENRIWRDVTGWAFQDLAAKADKVDVIWYGINQTIKGGMIV